MFSEKGMQQINIHVWFRIYWHFCILFICELECLVLASSLHEQHEHQHRQSLFDAFIWHETRIT